MMYSKVLSSSVLGVDAYPVIVETDFASGINRPHIIVGLPDIAVKESKERIEFAVKNSKIEFPSFQRFIINLAPAHTKKEGPIFDLPIAVGVLISAGQLTQKSVENTLLVGELSLDGQLRPVKGILSMCLMAKKEGMKKVIVPFDNAEEAVLVEGLEIVAVNYFSEAYSFLQDNNSVPLYKPKGKNVETIINDVDFSEVKGQQFAKRALEVAAAGGHNILLIGNPGSGKTMLARRLPTILPPLGREEALEVTRLNSISGLLPERHGLITSRPFRAPHHTISYAGLLGGGTIPKPGEITLAHHGILFLDELLEFNRQYLEMLRQPLEDGEVTISRANASLTYPAKFMLVGSTNPCPCGYAMDPDKSCSCNPAKINKYWSKMSGPILDRIDMFVEVPKLKKDELMKKPKGESSKDIRQRILKARDIQSKRFKEEGVARNGVMKSKQVQKYCILDEAAEKMLRDSLERFKLTGRSYDRVLRVSRTIADLEGADIIQPKHIAEVLQYRTLLLESFIR